MTEVAIVNATALKEWSAQRDAQGRLPQLVRRLVWATIEVPRRVDFPSGEGVQRPGWDGIVEVEQGNVYVPSGRSAWEVSTESRPKDKADRDYRKRKKDPEGLEPRETTFVFVTSRCMYKKRAWADERRAEGVWRDVRAYDADDLEQWLELAPEVRVWLRTVMGLPVRGVSTLEDFWKNWAAVTQPPLRPEVAVAGRGDAVQVVRRWLREPPSTLTVLSDSPDEGLVFVAAALLSLPEEEGASAQARTLVVSDTRTLSSLSSSSRGLILLPEPDVEPAMVPIAANRGHHALLLIQGPTGAPPVVHLARLDPAALEGELKKLGLEEERARWLSRNSGRRMVVLRRLLSATPGLLRPPWAAAAEARALVPALLAGSWDGGSEPDKEAIGRIARRPYAEVLDTVVRWANEPDPPLKLAHDEWSWFSREDSWSSLAPFITRDDLDAFQEVALEVLGDPDPRYDMPLGERWMAPVKRAVPRYSQKLKTGVAETVALLGARSATAGIRDALDPAVRASVIVSHVFLNKGWRAFADLSGVLTDLAEAAPDRFIEAVESLTDDDVRTLFQGEEGIMGGAPHCSLLWALEALAWNPAYLTRVTNVLGRLARLDPGGRLSNRPANSLQEIFVGWLPHTRANFEQRLSAIDALLRREPDAGWKLLMKLLPRWAGDSTFNTHTPRWRDWALDWSGAVTPGAEYAKWVLAICNRALQAVDLDGGRWSQLIQHLGEAVPTEIRDEAVKALIRATDQMDQPEGRLKVWKALRDLLHHHRQFPDAGWAMPSEVLGRLDEIYRKLEPENLVQRFAWLFTSWPNLPEPEGDDWRAEAAARDREREKAVRAVLSRGGIELLLQMIPEVEEPRLLGGAAGLLDDNGIESVLLTRTLGSDDKAQRACGLGFVGARFHKRGWSWAENYLRRRDGYDLDDRQLARFACALPFEPRTWDAVAGAGKTVENSYWREIPAYRFTIKDGPTLARAVSQFLNVGRPQAALMLAADSVDQYDGSSPLSAANLATILDQVLSADPKSEEPQVPPANISYGVQRLFLALSKGDFDRSRLAALEWAYLPALKHGEYKPRAIYEALTRSPAFFAEVVEAVFKQEGRDEPVEPPDEAALARARRGHEVLISCRTIPGVSDDGGVDAGALRSWINEVRARCAALRRARAADVKIGQILAHAPSETGVWPAMAVRELIEEVASPHLERGLEIGIMNKRGIVTKDYAEGGLQERELAAQYRDWATKIAPSWPRTSAVLERVASNYEGEAKRADVEAEARLD